MPQKHKIAVAHAGRAGAEGHLRSGALPAHGSGFCVITQHGCSGSVGHSSVRKVRTERTRSRRFCKIHRGFLRYSVSRTSALPSPLTLTVLCLCAIIYHLLSLSSSEGISFRSLGTFFICPCFPIPDTAAGVFRCTLNSFRMNSRIKLFHFDMLKGLVPVSLRALCM